MKNGLNKILSKIGIILLIVGLIAFFAGIFIQSGYHAKDEFISANQYLGASPTISRDLYGNYAMAPEMAENMAKIIETKGDTWDVESDKRFAAILEAIKGAIPDATLPGDVKDSMIKSIYSRKDEIGLDADAILEACVTYAAEAAPDYPLTEDATRPVGRKLRVLQNNWAESTPLEPIDTKSFSATLISFAKTNIIVFSAIAVMGLGLVLLILTGLTKRKPGVTDLKSFFRTDEVTTAIPLIVIMAITTIFRPDFLSVRNFSSMFNQIPFIAICALGASFPLMVGHVDISTGRVAGFAGILMAAAILDWGWSTPVAIIVAILACLVVGLWNGFLVVYMGIPDFVATMGTLYMVGGARYLFIHGYELTLGRLPSFRLDEVFDARYLGMPLYFWIMLLLVAILFIIIKKMVVGRQILATGDNREVANIVGINTNRIRMIAYMCASFFSAIAGILLVLDTSFAKPEYGDGWEFRAIAGCVVGGVSLSGGKCSPLGILIGVTLVFVAENAIIFLGLPSTLREAVKGVLMAGAVLFDIFRSSRKVSA